MKSCGKAGSEKLIDALRERSSGAGYLPWAEVSVQIAIPFIGALSLIAGVMITVLAFRSGL